MAVNFVDEFKKSVEGPSICKNCDAIGSNFAKANGLSPDALIQMAFQLGYYRVHGEPASTYEAATTGLFKHGRTETIRSCLSLSTEMCKVFTDPSSPKTARQAALKAAVDHHLNHYISKAESKVRQAAERTDKFLDKHTRFGMPNKKGSGIVSSILKSINPIHDFILLVCNLFNSINLIFGC